MTTSTGPPDKAEPRTPTTPRTATSPRTATRSPATATAPPVAAVAAAVAGRPVARGRRCRWRRTIRPTPSCTSAPRAPRPPRSDSGRDPGHQRFHPAGGQASAPPRRPRRRPSPAADPDRGRVPGPPRGRRAGHGRPRQGPHRTAARGRALHPDRGARGRRRRRALRHLGGDPASLVGNIYLGIVQNVLPSMEAAFVDIGRGRNGVLYAGEVNWEAAGLGGAQPQDRAGAQARRLRRRPGQQGPGRPQGRPADHAGLAGRPLPGLRARVRRRPASAASCPTPSVSGSRRSCARWCPPDAGVIIRTASEGVKEDDIRADVNRLQERWTAIAEASRARSKARRPAPRSRSTKSPTSWSR